MHTIELKLFCNSWNFTPRLTGFNHIGKQMMPTLLYVQPDRRLKFPVLLTRSLLLAEGQTYMAKRRRALAKELAYKSCAVNRLLSDWGHFNGPLEAKNTSCRFYSKVLIYKITKRIFHSVHWTILYRIF